MANGDDTQDVEQLRAERDRLQSEVERMQGVKRHRLRAVAAVLAVVVAVASFSLALPGAWARRTIADADTYLSVVGPLADDPAVQEALSREITTAVFEALDVQGKLTAVLTEKAPQLTFLAGPITSSVQGFVQDQVQKIVASDQFQQFWTEANRVIQLQVIAVLRGDSTVVQVQGDRVVLNYLPLVNQALQSASATISQLIGRSLTLPEITPDMIPAEAIQKLDSALGVTLPADFGTLVVFNSDQLPKLQYAVNTARQGLYGLVALFFLSMVVAIWVSPRRRRTILQLAVGIAVVTVIERRLGISSVGGRSTRHATNPNAAPIRTTRNDQPIVRSNSHRIPTATTPIPTSTGSRCAATHVEVGPASTEPSVCTALRARSATPRRNATTHPYGPVSSATTTVSNARRRNKRV